MTTPERTIQPESLSPVQLGEKTFKAITDLKTKLRATPAFMTVLGLTFFGRNSKDPKGNIVDTVVFRLGGYVYSVEYNASTLHSNQEKNSDNARISLFLNKYDLPREDEDLEAKKIAALRLTSVFREDQKYRVIKGFVLGDAVLEEDFGADLSDPIPRAMSRFEGKKALDKISSTFTDLYGSY